MNRRPPNDILSATDYDPMNSHLCSAHHPQRVQYTFLLLPLLLAPVHFSFSLSLFWVRVFKLTTHTINENGYGGHGADKVVMKRVVGKIKKKLRNANDPIGSWCTSFNSVRVQQKKNIELSFDDPPPTTTMNPTLSLDARLRARVEGKKKVVKIDCCTAVAPIRHAGRPLQPREWREWEKKNCERCIASTQ